MIQPAFVTHLPKDFVPLAKLSPDDPPARPKPLRRDEGPSTVEVFESRRDSRKLARHEVSGGHGVDSVLKGRRKYHAASSAVPSGRMSFAS